MTDLSDASEATSEGFSARDALEPLEPRLRFLLPAKLYVDTWVDPSPANLEHIFDHLRTLVRILHDYVPRELAEDPPRPGELRREWQEATLMFTDLAGFTPLLEANAQRGKDGARILFRIINRYFAAMLETISKSGGSILEFTGDAMLVQFPANDMGDDTQKAIRAGLRMQRRMQEFSNIETYQGVFSLGMRIGIHQGVFLTADIGTPRRMEHVLLGKCVQVAKHAEGAGKVGRVNLTDHAYERVRSDFKFEEGEPGHMLVIDDLAEDELGSYELSIARRRTGANVLLDRSIEAMMSRITEMLVRAEDLAAFIPTAVLEMLVEQASERQIMPETPDAVVIFVNLIGLPESVDDATPEEVTSIVSSYSSVFSRINAEVESRGGILKKVTYHLAGSDIMIFFGVPNSHSNDVVRAVETARAIRETVERMETPIVNGKSIHVDVQIGVGYGSVFSSEIGEPRGRREFNILGDTVNTSARLMGRAVGNRILMTDAVRANLPETYYLDSMGSMPLKGKSGRLPIFSLPSSVVRTRKTEMLNKIIGDDGRRTPAIAKTRVKGLKPQKR